MTSYPPIDNPSLRHAGVTVVSMTPDRVVMGSTSPNDVDPLTKLILHLEPTAARGHEHMPSLEEMRAAGLIRN